MQRIGGKDGGQHTSASFFFDLDVTIQVSSSNREVSVDYADTLQVSSSDSLQAFFEFYQTHDMVWYRFKCLLEQDLL